MYTIYIVNINSIAVAKGRERKKFFLYESLLIVMMHVTKFFVMACLV